MEGNSDKWNGCYLGILFTVKKLEVCTAGGRDHTHTHTRSQKLDCQTK